MRATAGGGLLMDWGVYDLDWMGFLLGKLFDPVAVFARTDNWRWEEGDIDSSFSAEILLSSGISIAWERRIEHGPDNKRIEIRGAAAGLDLPFMPGDLPAQDFVSAILNDHAVASPPASQVMIHGVIDALYESAASGRSEEVKP
jgi:predicted dehydrogenase